MRKLLVCVPMISLLLLTGCSGNGGMGEAERKALEIQELYRSMTGCTACAGITADYGRRVYHYEMTLSAEGEDVRLALTAPETVAGITARLTGDHGLLEYDGLVLETGPLDEEGLTPVSAVPVLLETARSGFITAGSFPEEGVLRVDCSDPEREPGQGRSVSLWFDADSCSLQRGEISADGRRVIACEFTDFSMG